MALQEELEEQGKWLFRYRGILPIIVIGIGLAVYLISKVSSDQFFLWETSYETGYELLCLFVGLLGLGIRIYTVGYTPRKTSGRGAKKLVAKTLNTEGPYSIVRHPLYVGNFLMWLSPALLTANLWFIIAFILLYWLYYERIMYAEEQFLRAKFKEVYVDWANNIPAFVPDFKKFKKPTLSFNWKRVLQKERNGLALLLILFFIFDFLGEWIRNENDYNYVIMIGCIISIVTFIVLKTIEKNTSILHESLD